MQLSYLKLSTLAVTFIACGFSRPLFADNTLVGAPNWSTPARGIAEQQAENTSKLTIEGSEKSYTLTQINNKFSAPDWFPNTHVKMPDIVAFGKKPKVWACASCHLASGTGHPESATLVGLTSAYMQSQMKAFADGSRIDYSGHMNRMAKALTSQEIKQASDWFASLPPKNMVTVKEVDEVPATIVDETRMRQVVDGGGVEKIGQRIIEVPVDRTQVSLRDPNSPFISYVPKGSLARGKKLVSTGGGKTTPCLSCHGATLTGSPIAPQIIGNFGIYTVRQLHGFKGGTRKGAQSALMSGVVANLSDQDIIDISAYLSSLSTASGG